MPDDPVAFAVLTAQKLGKPQIREMIRVLDELLGDRRVDMGVVARVYGDTKVDWEAWGRRTYILEEVLALLQRIDSDEEARDFLRKRIRENTRGARLPKNSSGYVTETSSEGLDRGR